MTLYGDPEWLFKRCGEAIVFKWDHHERRRNVCNWLIDSVRSSEFSRFILDEVSKVTNNLHKQYGNQITRNIINISGPGVFTHAAASFLKSYTDPSASRCGVPIEIVEYAPQCVQGGRRLVNKSLQYKETHLHWLKFS